MSLVARRPDDDPPDDERNRKLPKPAGHYDDIAEPDPNQTLAEIVKDEEQRLRDEEQRLQGIRPSIFARGRGRGRGRGRPQLNLDDDAPLFNPQNLNANNLLINNPAILAMFNAQLAPENQVVAPQLVPEEPPPEEPENERME